MGCPTVDGYTVEPVDRRVSSEMDIGTVTRVEFPTDETTANCTLFLDELQASWFEALEHEKLKQGSLWIRMRLWVAGHLKEHVVRFRDRPKLSSKTGGHSTYTFTLEVEKRFGMMDGELFDLLLDWDPYIIGRASDRLHFLLHVWLPGIIIREIALHGEEAVKELLVLWNPEIIDRASDRLHYLLYEWLPNFTRAELKIPDSPPPEPPAVLRNLWNSDIINSRSDRLHHLMHVWLPSVKRATIGLEGWNWQKP
jgi:hypothetical protein